MAFRRRRNFRFAPRRRFVSRGRRSFSRGRSTYRRRGSAGRRRRMPIGFRM